MINRIERLNELLQQNEKDCFVLHALGLEYMKIEENDKAIHFFNRVVETDEHYVGTYYHLGRALELANQPEQAKSIYEKGIEVAKKLKDRHAQNELQMVLDELE